MRKHVKVKRMEQGSPNHLSQGSGTVSSSLIRWILFDVILGLFPIVALAIVAISRINKTPWEDILGSGELLLACVIIGMGIVGSLIGQRSPVENWKYCLKILFAGLVALLSLVSAVWYMAVYLIRDQLDIVFVIKGSLFMLGLIFVAGVFSIIVVGVTHE
jgi:hypothetical protein